MPRKSEPKQRWWCSKCDSVVETPIRVLAVHCSNKKHGTTPGVPMTLIEGEPAKAVANKRKKIQ